jgi:phosphatidate cytidylyltransferase
MGLTIVAATLCGGMGIPAIGLAFVLAGTLAATRWEGNPWTSGSRARFAHPAFHLALGFPYLGLAAVALPWLRADQDVGLANTLFVLALIWASDVGAYLTGRLIGGPRLAPAISPGKTWSGAIGGLLSAGLAGLAVAACFSSGFSPFHVTILAIGLGLVSQAGDLFESALKRRFGVKDSGRIIPGHGGMLDRLDALLAVAPVAALLAFSVGRGVVLWR